MGNITFYQDGQVTSIPANPEETILSVARRGGVRLESPCDGNGTCGKCKVKVMREGKEEVVLACQTPVQSTSVVEIIDRSDGDNLQIKQDGLAPTLVIDSIIQKKYIADIHTTEVYRSGECIASEQGDTAKEGYGLAVDIGTTTLVVSLVDLLSGRELAVAVALNPQSRLAQDVLSRIRYATNEQGLTEMHQLFMSELNKMIEQVTQAAGACCEQIYDVVLSGNTCMLHLAVKANPVSLGKYPYTSVIRGGDVFAAAELGIHTANSAQAYLPPVISAYVGADITSGILAAGLAEQRGISLFIDIGTNGEIVLADNGKLAATSTAAGPAFEGMNIACGMRAAPGAIEGFRLTDQAERIVKTIGDRPAIGICGSGLLDIIAELVRHGLIGNNGKLSKSLPREFADLVTAINGKTVFAVSEDVYIHQQDIRQVQLAKGAIRAGIEALLDHRGLKADAVDRVLIAGSFGYHLNPASIVGIGLLPAVVQGKIEFLGNTSKTGGQAFLLDKESRRKINKDIAGVIVLELATLNNFDKLFVKCLDF